MAAYQAPPSLGFSRQEYWSGMPFPSPMHESEKWKWSRSVVSNSSRPHRLQPTRLLRPWDFPGKSTGVGCHCLLQRQAECISKTKQRNALLAHAPNSLRFNYVEVCSFYACFLQGFHHKWMLNFVKGLLCTYWDNHMVFIFQFVNVVYYIDWLADIEESLHPWDKAHLVMVYDLFNVLLDSDC